MSGPEDQHPWDREDEEIREAFAKKDAEIKRLKGVIESQKRENAQLKQWALMTDEQVIMDLKAEIERLKEEAAKLKESLETSDARNWVCFGVTIENRDVQIERLKAEQIKMFEMYDALEQKSVGQRAVITELEQEIRRLKGE